MLNLGFFMYYFQKEWHLTFLKSFKNILYIYYLITGSSISVLYTLTGSYDKNNICTKKIGVDIFSVYLDISFGNKKSENITEISFFNRNNRNYKNNISKLHKIFKIVSRLLKTKFRSVFVI